MNPAQAQTRPPTADQDFFLGNGVTLHGRVSIQKNAEIWHHSIVGFSEDSTESFELSKDSSSPDVTYIGERTRILPFCLVFRGAKIGKDVTIDEYSRIGYRTVIGDGTRVVYGAKIYDNIHIGNKSIIAGFCCDGSSIGSNTTMMGHLLHKYPTHAIDVWDDENFQPGPSPVIEDNCLVLYNSIIIGGVTIHHHSTVGAGAIIIEDLPPYSRAVTRGTLRFLPGGIPSDK
jgi:acetyltransferase-like isoleucine patch superfamily enzyme